jgi:hypothetical protein
MSMTQAGVIPDTKTGYSLVKKMEDKETRPEVTKYMARLTDRQVAMLTNVVDKRISSLPFLIRGGAKNIYQGMVRSSRDIRAKSGLAGEGVNIGFNMGDAVNLGVSMFDKKGFDLDIRSDYAGVTYRKAF